MGGDDELGAGVRCPGHDREQRERAGDRQCRLWLVEQIETVCAESVGGERQERFAMGLLVERDLAEYREVRSEPVAAVDELGDVEEALGSQEVAVSRRTYRPSPRRLFAAAPEAAGAWPRAGRNSRGGTTAGMTA